MIPCASAGYPDRCAPRYYTAESDGLSQPWSGRVWLNPPYGPEATLWLARLAAHGNGIALVFARTETRNFFENVWGAADALLFLRGRLRFLRPDLIVGAKASGAPSVLVAYGERNARVLAECGLDGFYVGLVSAQGAESPA